MSSTSLTLEEKWQVIYANATNRYERLAVSKGETIGHFEGILTTQEYATINGKGGFSDTGSINQMLAWYRENGSSKAPILYWLDPEPPTARQNAHMLARGVSPNWKPHWMWCCLKEGGSKGSRDLLVNVRKSTPEELKSGSDDEDKLIGRQMDSFPDLIHHFVALRGGDRVGSCLLNLTGGEYSGAGLYDMWVGPEHRRQGIGTALSREAMQDAQHHGYSHMYLNATPEGEKLYSSVGFESMGSGFTWHLKKDFSTTRAPDERLAHILESLLLGELSEVDDLITMIDIEALQHPTANGMTPLELAVHAEHALSARFLLDRGVVPDIMSLWNLGWKDEARAWLVRTPSLVNRRGGEMSATPLHYAVERNDVELAKLIVAVKEYDFTIKDGSFGSTASGWAEHLNRPEILRLIERRRNGAT